jgi:hypothetical protein
MEDTPSPKNAKLIPKEMSEYSTREYIDNWLDQMREKCQYIGGKKLLEISQEYLDSVEIETQDEDMLILLGWLMKTIRSLPESLNVTEFTGPEHMIQILQEQLWTELKLRAESDRLSEQLRSFAALVNLLQYVNSYQKGKRPLKAQMSESSPSTGKTKKEAEGICNSSTIATRTTAAAGARSSKGYPSLYNLLKEQSTPQLWSSITSLVSSYICAR